MTDILLLDPALAPNGEQYPLHQSRSRSGSFGRPIDNRGYVYAYGHRVYGTYGSPDLNHQPEPVRHFTPTGKWAFILAVPNAATQAVLDGEELTVS